MSDHLGKDLDFDAPDEPGGDATDPRHPFGQLIAAALDPDGMRRIGGNDSELDDALAARWYTQTMARFQERYRLWDPLGRLPPGAALRGGRLKPSATGRRIITRCTKTPTKTASWAVCQGSSSEKAPAACRQLVIIRLARCRPWWTPVRLGMARCGSCSRASSCETGGIATGLGWLGERTRRRYRRPQMTTPVRRRWGSG